MTKAIDLPEKELRDLRLERNMSIQEIAEYYGVSLGCASRNLKKYKINKPKSQDVFDVGKAIKLSQEGMTLNEISKVMKQSTSFISKRLLESGYSIREEKQKNLEPQIPDFNNDIEYTDFEYYRALAHAKRNPIRVVVGHYWEGGFLDERKAN